MSIAPPPFSPSVLSLPPLFQPRSYSHPGTHPPLDTRPPSPSQCDVPRSRSPSPSPPPHVFHPLIPITHPPGLFPPNAYPPPPSPSPRSYVPPGLFRHHSRLHPSAHRDNLEGVGLAPLTPSEIARLFATSSTEPASPLASKTAWDDDWGFEGLARPGPVAPNSDAADARAECKRLAFSYTAEKHLDRVVLWELVHFGGYSREQIWTYCERRMDMIQERMNRMEDGDVGRKKTARLRVWQREWLELQRLAVERREKERMWVQAKYGNRMTLPQPFPSWLQPPSYESMRGKKMVKIRPELDFTVVVKEGIFCDAPEDFPAVRRWTDMVDESEKRKGWKSRSPASPSSRRPDKGQQKGLIHVIAPRLLDGTARAGRVFPYTGVRSMREVGPSDESDAFRSVEAKDLMLPLMKDTVGAHQRGELLLKIQKDIERKRLEPRRVMWQVRQGFRPLGSPVPLSSSQAQQQSCHMMVAQDVRRRETADTRELGAPRGPVRRILGVLPNKRSEMQRRLGDSPGLGQLLDMESRRRHLGNLPMPWSQSGRQSPGFAPLPASATTPAASPPRFIPPSTPQRNRIGTSVQGGTGNQSLYATPPGNTNPYPQMRRQDAAPGSAALAYSSPLAAPPMTMNQLSSSPMQMPSSPSVRTLPLDPRLGNHETLNMLARMATMHGTQYRARMTESKRERGDDVGDGGGDSKRPRLV